MSLRRFLVVLTTLVFTAGPALALDPINSTGANHLAIRGTDTTAYFQSAGPAEGNASHVVKWKGATWRFSSKSQADLFRADPAAYAPQFGAYCTGGLSQHHVVEGKPQNWHIHKGKLYLFYSKRGAERFAQNPEEIIQKAQDYWDTLDVVE